MIVGTGGHIDHGKTALLAALTGQAGDRRREERERGITIDLGYRYADLGGGEPTGFIDVPGHERFVRNMLAGACGIDLLLLVVAADDGVMPQTREHLAIAELLGIPKALVALSKIDRAVPERIEAVRAEIAALLAPGPRSFRCPASRARASRRCVRPWPRRLATSRHAATPATSAWPSIAPSASAAPAW